MAQKKHWLDNNAAEKHRKFNCPACRGSGQTSVPGVRNGKFVTTYKPCRKCRGSGKLVIALDSPELRKLKNRSNG